MGTTDPWAASRQDEGHQLSII
ncbi:hypothetical protein LCGC14_1494920, partial [marine sediment metagenome]